jgi:hypothetical protein
MEGQGGMITFSLSSPYIVAIGRLLKPVKGISKPVMLP